MKIRDTYMIKQAGIIFCLLFIGLIAVPRQTRAQLYPLGGSYFQNQYLANPAMAGLEEGLILNLNYRQQWSSMPGSPKTQGLTAAYGFSNRVGLGLNFYNDKAGLLRRTRLMGTYAYHLPAGPDEQKLSFGLSFGFLNENINSGDIKGDAGDVNIGRFNERKTFIDGDFGVSYTGNGFTIQGAIPNMKTFMKKEDNSRVDYPVFYSALSYKFQFPQSLEGMTVEPKLVYRGIKNYKNIADLGANFALANNAINVMMMYHTSESATFGMGMNYKQLFIMGTYTTETAALTGYANGNFELALKASLF